MARTNAQDEQNGTSTVTGWKARGSGARGAIPFARNQVHAGDQGGGEAIPLIANGLLAAGKRGADAALGEKTHGAGISHNESIPAVVDLPLVVDAPGPGDLDFAGQDLAVSRDPHRGGLRVLPRRGLGLQRYVERRAFPAHDHLAGGIERDLVLFAVDRALEFLTKRLAIGDARDIPPELRVPDLDLEGNGFGGGIRAERSYAPAPRK
jgi:hypothetical protein